MNLSRMPTLIAARAYHMQVSRREDMRLGYRPSFEVIFQATEHHSPFGGLFSPGQTYYRLVRPRNAHGLWGPWSPLWRFTWRGPRRSWASG